MKTIKIIFLYLFFGLSFLVRGQQIGNYVNNGSFESCPNCQPWAINVEYWGAIDSASYYAIYCSLTPPISNLPNFANALHYPRTGNSMIGSSPLCISCGTGSRGYPRNRLKQNLKPNTTYCVKCYLFNRKTNSLAMDGFGIYFGSASLDTINYCTIPLTYLNPQVQNSPGNILFDTINWIPITGTFVATGNEKYLVLGNFKSNSSTTTISLNSAVDRFADMLIDDVSVIELNLPAYAGRDTTIYLGDSLFIGRQPDFATDTGCIWYKLPNMTTSLDTVSGIWVKPTTTSTYAVRQVLDCSPLKWDTVVVTVSTNYVGLDKLQSLSDGISLFPNPTSGNLAISGFSGSDNSTFRISNCLGQNVLNGDIIQKNDSITIQTSELESGLYQIHLKTQHGIVTKKFVKTN